MNIDFIGNGNITSLNFNASYIINGHILFDTPAGMYKKLMETNHNLDDIDVIVISHLHGDHYFDLPFLLFSMFASSREKPLIIVGPKSLKRKIKKLSKLAFPHSYNKIFNNIDLTFCDAASISNTLLGDIYATSITLNHGHMKPCYGYIFDNGEKRTGFTGDTELCPGLSYMLKEVDYVVIDVCNKGANHHLPLDDFKELCNEYKITFLPTHYPDKIRDELAKIKNVKLINCNEQFYI